MTRSFTPARPEPQSAHRRPRRSRAGDVLRGLLALVLVTALVVGIPWALIEWVGWPLPATMPSFGEMGDALRSSYVADETIVKVIACVCWIIWAQLVASLLVETFAYIRGRRAGRVPLAGGLQRAAARLIATVALIGALAAARSGQGVVTTTKPFTLPGSTPTELVLVSADEKARTVLPVDGAGDLAEPPAGPVPAEPRPVYVVQRYDSLWDIAERHLGNGLRWHEIFQLNRDTVQADGSRLENPDHLQVGWRLELPADAQHLPPVDTPLEPEPEPAPAAAAPVPAPDADQGKTPTLPVSES
jgi:hypothetical protein